MAANLIEIMAEAIKEADRSWFNEDYTRQAVNVSRMLRQRGYEIVPMKPSEALVAYVDENMPFGRLKPADLIRELYVLMVENARRLEHAPPPPKD